MILRALHTSGILDISSQESLQVYNETEPFRLALRPGQVVEVEDHWRKLKNIHNAINCGLLEVVAYDYENVGEEVTHAELTETLEGYTPSPGGGSGECNNAEVNVYPVESPNGAIRTFTLPNDHAYESGGIAVMINGQVLPPADFTEGSELKTITLNAGVDTPQADDVVTLTYTREGSCVGLADFSVVQRPPSGTGSLVYDNTTGIFTYTPPLVSGSGFSSDITLELSEYPIEAPGSGRTFTLPYGHTFEPGTVKLILNGQTLPEGDIVENGSTSVTLAAGIPTPQADDVIVLTYLRTVYPIETGEYPVESPDGSNRTFTLVGGDYFVEDKIAVMINGIFVDPALITKAVDGTSVTISSSYPAPKEEDVINLMYSRSTGYPIEINVYSVEQPDGINRTFTLPNGDTYVSGDVDLILNGQRLHSDDLMENASKTSVTLDPSFPTPENGDVTTLIYMKGS